LAGAREAASRNGGLTPTLLATDLSLSMRAMQEYIQRYFGFSPRDSLTECRLESARQYL